MTTNYVVVETCALVRNRLDGEVAYVRKAAGTQKRGRRVVDRMRGRATVRMTTDEIMALTRGA